ncbi:MAG: hypothetical protein QW728_01650 [Thermoplasmata archaeon]
MIKKGYLLLLKNNNKGVSGFFEDIPALIVVTIGIGMFFMSAAFAIYHHTRQTYDIETSFKYFDIIKTLRNYDGLCYIEEGSANRLEGFFDAHKVYYLSVYNISKDIPELAGVSPESTVVPDYMKSSDDKIKVREWQLIIVDFSNYPYKYSKEVNNTADIEKARQRPNKEIFQTSVNIRVSDEEIHVAKMTFTVFQWKDEFVYE